MPARNGKSSAPASVKASEERSALALREAAMLMQPVVQWLLRSGVNYGAFANLLKAVFVNVARQELQRGGSKDTHSALSVLSGVHRKDVRALAEAGPATTPPQRSISLASQVFTRWLTDARYRDRGGHPRSLARSGHRTSFESLARDISSDIHPRTVLEELIRLGLVTLEGDTVVPAARAFVPSRKLDEMTALFAATTADHLAAGVHNLTTEEPRFLEQSIFATGLSKVSVDTLHETAREIWSQAFEKMMNEGRQCIGADGDVQDPHRMRFGLYYYSESTPEQPRSGRAVKSTAQSPQRKSPTNKARSASASGKSAPRARKSS